MTISFYKYLLGIVVLCLCVCCTKIATVVLQIPKDFSGLVLLIKDEEHGVKPIKKDGRFIYELPADGVLYVNTLKNFHEWHNVEFVVGNESLEVIRVEHQYSGQGVVCWSLGWVKRNKEAMVYVIGDKKVKEKILAQKPWSL